MGLFLRVGHRAGCAFCLDAAPEAGVITIVPPERSRVSVLEYARAAPGIPPVGRGAWAFMRRGAEVGLRLAAAHPPGPHWHLLAMGIVPAQQGRGLGRRSTRRGRWRAGGCGRRR